MFYVDINAEVENQQATEKEARNIASRNGSSCDVRPTQPLRMAMYTSNVSPKSSPTMKHRLIKDESMVENDEVDEEDVNPMFARCKSSKYFSFH